MALNFQVKCGKTTLAREFRSDHYFDLENPRDIARFENPQIALEDLILGSVSRVLIRQSLESLAGRIGFYNLFGFRFHDIGSDNINRLWIRGTMPDSFLAVNESQSFLWRENYISTFLERDIPLLGINIPANNTIG